MHIYTLWTTFHGLTFSTNSHWVCAVRAWHHHDIIVVLFFFLFRTWIKSFHGDTFCYCKKGRTMQWMYPKMSRNVKYSNEELHPQSGSSEGDVLSTSTLASSSLHYSDDSSLGLMSLSRSSFRFEEKGNVPLLHMYYEQVPSTTAVFCFQRLSASCCYMLTIIRHK